MNICKGQAPRWPLGIPTSWDSCPCIFVSHTVSWLVCVTNRISQKWLYALKGNMASFLLSSELFILKDTKQLYVGVRMKRNWGHMPTAMWVNRLERASPRCSPTFRWLQPCLSSWFQPHEMRENHPGRPFPDLWFPEMFVILRH